LGGGAKILVGKDKDETEKIAPLSCRFHDLRRTAVSRMLNAGVPLAKVAKIVGWSASTMVLMAKRYGHFSLNELRDAVESISNGRIEAASLVKSPLSEKSERTVRLN
jgi:integrase